MPLDPSFVGRTWPAHRYVVGREKVREFAEALGSTDPCHRDPEAARAAGHPDVVAPPTFAVVFTWAATRDLVADPELGLDFSRVVHRDQSFSFARPVRAGDELTTTATVTDVRVLAGHDVLSVRCDVVDADGADVATVTTTLVGRADADPAGAP